MNETYAELWEKDWVHRCSQDKPSASQIGNLTECGAFINGPTGEAALKGTICHYALQHEYIPIGIPQLELKKIKWVQKQMQLLFDAGWEIVHKEKYNEDDDVTGSYDILLRRNGIYLVIDYKTGIVLSFWKTGRPLTPDLNNKQLGTYAHFVYNDDEFDNVEEVHTALLQPKKGFFKIVNEWTREKCRSLITDVKLIDYETPYASLDACAYCVREECASRV